jgi:hypothetical protein
VVTLLLLNIKNIKIKLNNINKIMNIYKYKIEDNFNFYEELTKNNQVDDKDYDNNTEVCLITGEKLIDYHVELICGHKFNYLPLYKDLINLKKNKFFCQHICIAQNKIRCPYCRKIQDLLPFYPELNLPKINGINYLAECIDEIPSNIPVLLCEFIINNPNPNPNPNPIPNPNYDLNFTNMPLFQDDNILINSEYTKCPQIGFKCKIDTILKYYCNTHSKIVLTQENLKKENLKQQKLQAKLAKASSIYNETLNVVFDSTKCNCLLKSGINKGKQCNYKIFENNLCKRHTTIVKK